MTFLVPCPNCGTRPAGEFSFGGESTRRPAPDSTLADLARYLFYRANVAGVQTEWVYHRDGCQRWFIARRDTRTNRFLETFWPHAQPGDGGTAA